MVTGRKYKVYSQDEYDALSARVERGARFLEGKWFDPAYVREVAHYNEMAMSLYNWDLDHGIIEKGILQMKERVSNENSKTTYKAVR